MWERPGEAEKTIYRKETPGPVPLAFRSPGGRKRSLFGDCHKHGPEGVRFFARPKTRAQRWPAGTRADFSIPTMRQRETLLE